MDMDDRTQRRKEAGRIFSRMGLSYFLFLSAALVFQIIILMIARWTDSRELFVGENRRIVLSMISMYAVGFPLFWQLVKRLPTGYGDSACEEEREKEKWGFLQFFICFLISIGVMEAGNLIGNILMSSLNKGMQTEQMNDVFTMIMESNFLIILLFAVVLGPVMEEIMFRKILIDRTIRFGEVKAVIVSGVLFGLVHGNFYQFFYACGLGMIFAYVYIRTGKIRYTIFMHMTINGMSSILAGGLMKNMEYAKFMELMTAGDMAGAMGVLGSHWISYMMLILYSLGLIVMAFVGIILLICVCLQKKVHFLPPVQPIPGRFTYVPYF
ncbi:CPBP family glutamic-type intramembrane protease [Clostridium sp. AM58-1XD]|uniref:CPBP family glutamic-type intramembrane protease n=1 Tax=Clostridium sp. AM58-1XD TaxID=2292307 RepID=UPI000E5095CF|nr:CPBP family glutamic-type intramembrane protease [Clostridium sp. AM58-1XD]RGZ00697.1 CPBP family intramembrane metalloprotease [Clostridium sp. AM58-1XD]